MFSGTLRIHGILLRAARSRSPVYHYFGWRLHLDRVQRCTDPAHSWLRVVRWVVLLAVMVAGYALVNVMGISRSTFALFILCYVGLQAIILFALIRSIFWPITVVNRASRMVGMAHLRHTWLDFLLLPYDRQEIVLYSIAPGYMSFQVAMGLLVAECAALLVHPLATPRTVLLIAVVVIEWMQWIVLCLVAGIMLGINNDPGRPSIYGALGGFALVLAHASGGMAITWLAGEPSSVMLASLIVGPPILLGTSIPFPLALVLSVLYLIALEVLVRRSFAWAIEHLGEADS